jgi:hypothetical protein
MIDLTALIRADILAALKVKAQQNGDPSVARPCYFPARMHFL